MTWAGLVWKNLRRRPVRTALTVAGMALGVSLIVALHAIAAGVRNTARDLIHVGRSDFGVFQEGAADLTRSLLPERLGEELARADGVERVARIFLRVERVGSRESFLVLGYARGEFPASRLVVVRGRTARGREALVGDTAARSLGLAPGDELVLRRGRFRIAGVYHSGDRFVDLGAVLPLAVVQELAARPGEVTTFGIVVEVGRRPADVARELERRFPGLVAVVEPGQAVRVDTSSRLILDAGWIFSLLALVVGGIGVTNTMAMSVFERVREIGILRAVGWRTTRIGLLVVSEALAIGLLALGIGLLAGFVAAEAFTDRGELAALVEADFTAGVFAWGLAFALGVALLGALYPAWRAVSLRPVEALRRE